MWSCVGYYELHEFIRITRISVLFFLEVQKYFNLFNNQFHWLK